MPKLKEITDSIERFAPLSLQESYDNAGLIVGDKNMEVTGALICLDSTEEVVDEAINLGFNLMISHHPIVFSGLKKFNGSNYVERVIIKAIKNNIAIYSAHTNLDNIKMGVNHKISEKLGMSDVRILAPMKERLRKLVTFCPVEHAGKVRQALFNAGGGVIGNYDECSFNTHGFGTFRAGDNTNPFIGKKGEQHQEKEERIEVILPDYLLSRAIKALIGAHPYEEVAYDIYPLENNNPQIGAGMIGKLSKPMDELEFLISLKEKMKTGLIRHTKLL